MQRATKRHASALPAAVTAIRERLPTLGTEVMIARLDALQKRLRVDSAEAAMLADALSTLRTLRDDVESVRQRYESLINAVPDAVLVLDLEGCILEANRAACLMFGHPREVLMRMHLTGINPDLPDNPLTEVERDFEVGAIFSTETTNVRADGTRFPVEVHSAVFLDRDDKRLVAVTRDITLRRKAEAELRASEARYRQLLHSMDKGIFVQDAEGRMLSTNPAACRILGVSEEDLLGEERVFRDWLVVDSEGQPVGFSQMPAIRALREARTIESTLLGVWNRARRHHVWISSTAVPQFREDEDRPFQVISMFSDVTALKRDSELYARTQALAKIGAWEWDPIRGRLHLTEELYRILDRPVESGLDLDTVLSQVAPEDLARVSATLRYAQRLGGHFDLTFRIRSPQDQPRWLRVLGEATLRDGEPFRSAGTMQDISESMAREDALARQAATDPLTGLANRDTIVAEIDALLPDAGFRQPTVLYVDLDRFKVINDLLGHHAGDVLLRAAADRLAACVGATGRVARFGGDEFVVLMPDASQPGAKTNLATRIAQSFEQPFEFDQEEFTITASVGVARFPEDGETAQLLIHHADVAMYEAKRRGRNTWQGFSSGLAQKLSNRLLMETQLRRALENAEFRLLYQPQVQLLDGRVQGAEALLRWNNRTLGETSPDLFIERAELTGDIVRIGAWVIREACRQMRAWRDAGLALQRIAVNVSFRQFLGEDLPNVVQRALREFELGGDLLELELTERVLIEDGPDTLHTFAALKAMGVKITIDDFGERYSALNYLRRLPIDGLKISHSFLRGVPQNGSDAALCRAVIGIARSLDLEVIAEGVETTAQRSFLLDAGARIAQGFLFAPALAADELAGYARTSMIGTR